MGDEPPSALARDDLVTEGAQIPALSDLFTQGRDLMRMFGGGGQVSQLVRVRPEVEQLVRITGRGDELLGPSTDHVHRGKCPFGEVFTDHSIGVRDGIAAEQRDQARPVELVGSWREPSASKLGERRHQIE
jgi:hypothetical protein